MNYPSLRRLFVVLPLLLPLQAFSRQEYVGFYDLYNGFSYFDSPDLHLIERGYHLQAGINPTTWYSLGFDYSIVMGNLTVTANQLPTKLQQQIGAQLAPLVAAGVIPPTYKLSIPSDSTTQTFAVGPQLDYRHFSRVTLFIRPSIGAIREVATPHATDPVAAGVVHQLAPSGKKSDWQGFYGVGGGLDLIATRHLSLRMQVDFVHNHLFNDILRDGRNTVRLSIGPTVHFGRNVAD